MAMPTFRAGALQAGGCVTLPRLSSTYLASTPAGAVGRKPCRHDHLRPLATPVGERRGLGGRCNPSALTVEPTPQALDSEMHTTESSTERAAL